MFDDLLLRASEVLPSDSDDLAWFHLRFAEFLLREGRIDAAAELVALAQDQVAESAPTRADLAVLATEIEAARAR